MTGVIIQSFSELVVSELFQLVADEHWACKIKADYMIDIGVS